MIQIAIIDDTSIHIKRLKKLIKSYMELHKISQYKLFSFSNAKDFYENLERNLKFHIIFMDIDLGQDSGISLASKLPSKLSQAQIIFVSQYLHYVSDVYEVNHCYFIYKDSLDKYLPIALDKAICQIQEDEILYFTFSWNRRSYKIRYQEILYMERIHRTTHIVTTSRIYCTSKTLDAIEKISNEYFLRCHKGFLVNKKHIMEIEKSYLVLDNQKDIPISRSKIHAVQEYLMNL